MAGMMRVRSIVFWIHLLLGVTAGAVILIMSASGVVLAFKPQILAMVDRGVRTVPHESATAPRLPLASLAGRIRTAKPGVKLTAIAVQADPSASVAVTLDGGTIVYVHPRSGELRGEGSRHAQAFFRSIEDWHRWLALPADSRATGRAITGACTIAFVFIALSGPVIWWPRRWSWVNLGNVGWFRRGGTPKARDFNWHNAIGIWCAPILIVLALTGTILSYRWATNLLYVVSGTRPAAAPRETPTAAAATPAPVQLDPLFNQAVQHVPTWRSVALRLPAHSGAPAVLTIVDAQSWNAFARSQLTLEPADATVIRWEPYSAFNLGQKMRGWARFSHTGELGGLPGQVAAATGCAGAVVLVWTGLALAARRLAGAVGPLMRRRNSGLSASSVER
jgi:uncharacterized iron-regulated membrane protein